jgi:hypothetical protein
MLYDIGMQRSYRNRFGRAAKLLEGPVMLNLVTPFTNVLEERRVFITDHTGFEGLWLMVWLHSRGARITGTPRDIIFRLGESAVLLRCFSPQCFTWSAPCPPSKDGS